MNNFTSEVVMENLGHLTISGFRQVATEIKISRLGGTFIVKLISYVMQDIN